MKQIELTRRSPWQKPIFLLVDDEDYPLVSRYSWYAMKRNRTTHAATQQINGKTIYVHQLLLPSPHPSLTPDHKNGNGLDNRRCNLRLATKSQQAANTPKRQGIMHSQYKGVCFSKREQKWKAYIDYEGRKHLGTFTSEVEAAVAYNLAAIKYFGEFAVLNITGAICN